MKIKTLASSSSGNCVYVGSDDTDILIDAGISMRRIKCGLSELSVSPDKLSGIFITHEHADHVQGLKMMCKYYHTRIFAPEIVAGNLARQFPEIKENIYVITPGSEIKIGALLVKAFYTPHDTEESVGYKVSDGNKTFALVTDLGTVTQSIYYEVLGVDAIVLEANHDVEMLKNGPYPYELKKRILSKHGHLSNTVSGKFAAELVKHGTKRIVLAHLSEYNNRPELALNTVKRILDDTLNDEYPYCLTVAPKDKPSELFEV